jgi:hypothetical protein
MFYLLSIIDVVWHWNQSATMFIVVILLYFNLCKMMHLVVTVNWSFLS